MKFFKIKKSIPEFRLLGLRKIFINLHILFLLTSAFFQLFVHQVQAQKKLLSFDLKTPLTEPRIFGEDIISTPLYERGGTFSPDGKEFYFTKRAPEGYFSAICVSRFTNGKWSKPEIASFSGQYLDSDPIISPDGNRLFFTSRRPVDGKPRPDTDIWFVNKTADGWSDPVNPGAPINTNYSEGYATLTRNGTMYFHSARPDGSQGEYDIYRSKLVGGKYTEPESLNSAINSKGSEAFPFIAPDESYLIFVSLNRSDELVGDGSTYFRGDLYLSFNKNGI